MRTSAGLHADQTRLQLGEERQLLLASELARDDDLALGIDAVDLEHLLCKVEPDGGNCRHGRPSLVIRFNDHSTALRCLLRRRPPHQGPTNHSPCGRSLRATAPPPATDSIGGLLLFVDVWGCVPIADDRSPEHTLRCEGWPEAW